MNIIKLQSDLRKQVEDLQKAIEKRILDLQTTDPELVSLISAYKTTSGILNHINMEIKKENA